MLDIENSQTEGEPLPAKAEDSDDAYYRGAWQKHAGPNGDRKKKFALLEREIADTEDDLLAARFILMLTNETRRPEEHRLRAKQVELTSRLLELLKRSAEDTRRVLMKRAELSNDWKQNER